MPILKELEKKNMEICIILSSSANWVAGISKYFIQLDFSN